MNQTDTSNRDFMLEAIWENSLQMTSSLDEVKSANSLCYILMGGVGILDVGLFLNKRSSPRKFELKRFRGIQTKAEKHPDIEIDDVMYDHFLANTQLVTTEALKTASAVPDDLGVFANYQPAYFLPLICNEKLVGIITLGEKLNKQAISDRESHMLTIIGACAANTFENTRLYNLAIRDELTNLFIRRHFDMRLEGEIQRARRHNLSLSVLVMDIDHFKAVNDTYGHRQGDDVLVAVANQTVLELRETDIPARYGGEEFTFLLPETPKPGAVVVAERIREAIEQMAVKSAKGTVQVTISIGVATFPGDATSGKDLVDCADKALYEAKRNGRNRVKVFQSEKNEYTPTQDAVAHLQETSLFVGLDERQATRVLNLAKSMAFDKGDMIFEQGDMGEDLYLILEGEVEVIQKQNGDAEAKVLNVLKGGSLLKNQEMGDFFGEMCLVDICPRSATIRVKTKTQLLKLNRDEIFGVFSEDRIMQSILLTNIARIQSRRLRRANVNEFGDISPDPA